MIAFVKKFWKWIVAGLAALSVALAAWQIGRLKKKIKLLELDKFVLETEAKNKLKKTEVTMDLDMAAALRKEAQRLLMVSSSRGMEIQKLEAELKTRLGDSFKDWDSLDRAAKGTDGNKAQTN
jgi:hypothetical protein